MSNKKTLEEHRKFIAGVTPKGTSSSIKQAFEKASEGQKIGKYRGNCTVCGEPFFEGFAVRCSICKGSIFHPGCFGTHAITVHSPTSSTVIVTSAGDDNSWWFVDAESDETVKEPEKEKVADSPEAVEVVEERVAGQKESEKEEEPAVIATTDTPKRAIRSKKRAKPKPLE